MNFILKIFGTSVSTQIFFIGWLQKRGEMYKTWHNRYFVLKGNLLFYFENKGDREPIGGIVLEGSTISMFF